MEKILLFFLSPLGSLALFLAIFFIGGGCFYYFCKLAEDDDKYYPQKLKNAVRIVITVIILVSIFWELAVFYFDVIKNQSQLIVFQLNCVLLFVEVLFVNGTAVVCDERVRDKKNGLI